MEVRTFQSFEEFGLDLTGVRCFLIKALQDDTILAEFASRGISRKEINDLVESVNRTARVFYNTSYPV